MKTEPLDIELECHIQEQNGISCIKHPLVYVVPYFGSEVEQEYANISLKQKKLKLEEYIDCNNYNGYVFLHERPYRFNAMIESIEIFKLSNEDIGQLARDVWCDSENIHELRKEWILFLNNRCGPSNFMSQEDICFMESLPSLVTIYRSANSMSSLSWTISKDTAEWFSKRFSRDGGIICREVPKNAIWAYTNERGENEVILLK